ncbi:MAG: hypothetical protein ABMB14_37190 [Myxococcota bacterium]
MATPMATMTIFCAVRASFATFGDGVSPSGKVPRIGGSCEIPLLG